jgi:hypothetical protein
MAVQACLFYVQERTMTAKTILVASLATLAIGVAAPGVAATATQSDSGGSGMMQQDAGSGQNSSTMGDAGAQGATGGGMMGMHGGGQGDEGASHAGMREGWRMHGGMMGMMGRGGAMGSGMMGMMEGCSMAMDAGLDRKTAMKMHGEMMRAMGDILIKYADKVQEPATKQ